MCGISKRIKISQKDVNSGKIQLNENIYLKFVVRDSSGYPQIWVYCFSQEESIELAQFPYGEQMFVQFSYLSFGRYLVEIRNNELRRLSNNIYQVLIYEKGFRTFWHRLDEVFVDKQFLYFVAKNCEGKKGVYAFKFNQKVEKGYKKMFPLEGGKAEKVANRVFLVSGPGSSKKWLALWKRGEASRYELEKKDGKWKVCGNSPKIIEDTCAKLNSNQEVH